MDVQADAWDFLRARDLVDDADAAEASGAGVLLTDEAREVKLENGLLFAQILKHYDVRCRPSRPVSLFLRAAPRRSLAAGCALPPLPARQPFPARAPRIR